MSRTAWCWAWLMTFLGAGAARAGAGSGLEDVGVGEWVVYRLDGGPGRVSYLRLAVVGAEKDAVWLELEVAPTPDLRAPLARMAVLVDRRRGLRPDGIRRLVIAHATDHPSEVDPLRLAALVASHYPEPAAVRTVGSDHVRVAGEEKDVSTPMGRIRARAVEVLAGGKVIQRFWTAPKVPLLHLAAIELPLEGQSAAVQSFGTAARRRMPPPPPDGPSIRTEHTGEPSR